MIVLDRRKYAPEGADGVPGGNASENPNPTAEGDPSNQEASEPNGSGKQGDFVKREILDTYKSDLKKLKARLRDAEKKNEEWDQAKNTAEEQKLLEQEKYKELLEKRDAEKAELLGKIDDLSGQISSYQNREVQGQKLQAFMDNADFKVDPKYLGFIDLDKIKIDETGSVIGTSVTEVIEKFQKEHPTLIQKATRNPSFSQPGVQTGSQRLTRAENLQVYLRNPKQSAHNAAKGLVD